MTDRADAHIHLFEGGYRGGLTGRPGVRVDEAALYDDLAREYGIRRALIVGYADAPWCAENNSWIAERAAEYPWARPLAFVDPCTPPDALMLERLAGLGFVGLSMYIASAARTRALAEIPDVLWGSLAERGWLVSVNSQPARWRAWQPVLARHATLRLLASHLGQAPPTAEPPSRDVASAALAPLLELAAWPGPRVKLSGFYAISDPAHDYPHRAAWPYVEALLEAFGPERLLWGSDFSPCLGSVSFPQAVEVLDALPFLSLAEREAIGGGNVLTLLGETP